MSLEIHPKQALINAALMTRRPVAFLVGSPLSLHEGIGVPGITTMLDFVRAEIRERAAIALPQFELALGEKTGADAYQAAMKWLGVNAGQDAVNEVIAKAVLQARKTEAGELLQGIDGEPDDWNIPAGTSGLAELVTRGGERFLGPILTTNFDPLVSLAVRKSGGRAGRRILTADGMLAGAAEDEPGICNVVHLHGFWRDSDTLHTQAQLTNDRPKLKASLQRLLVAKQRTLIVAAYGGWDDVFTQALVELMNDEQAKLDVIWCFHESDPDRVENRYGKLLEAVKPAMVLNRFRAFGGVDCHSIFTEILTALRENLSHESVTPVVSSPLAGWEQIDSAYLDSLPSLNQQEVVRYFDGAVPNWRHAASPAIPRRQAVLEIAKRLTNLQAGKEACSMQLIRAAGGEGKTTLLLQAATDALRTGNWSVLWRPSPYVRLLPEHVIKLDTTRQWLIVADDAENLVDDLKKSAAQLRAADRTNVHFLLAARDPDWRSKSGDQPEWETWLQAWVQRQQAIVLRGINSEDAVLVVEAWAKCGADGLGELSKLSETTAQVKALLNEARDSGQIFEDQRPSPVEGSFFGGLLAVRFGRHGLQAHVRAFLNRLKNHPIEGSTLTLFDALVYIAACHGTGIPGIDEKVLADLVRVPREWVQSRVVRPLGEETAAVHNAGHVLTRHSKVASAILVETEQTLGRDLAEIWAQLVRQTVYTSRNGGVSHETHSQILHAGPRLVNALPRQISLGRRKVIAVAAARADHEAQPERLGSIIGLAQTMRLTGDANSAASLFRQHLARASSLTDADLRIRAYWTEWGICEGAETKAGAAEAWLCGISLSDHLNPAPLTSKDGRLSFTGLGIAFGRLALPDPGCPFAKARRASAFLGRRFGPDPRAHLFDETIREADKLGTPHPSDVSEAIAWLAAGVADAGRKLEDPFLKELVEPGQISFSLLRNILTPRTRDDGPAYSAKAILPAIEPALTVKALQIPTRFDNKIQEGIERVLTETWKALPHDTAEHDRNRVAIKRAKEIISRLSPQIRRQVGAHFQTKNWEPLKSSDPKSESA